MTLKQEISQLKATISSKQERLKELLKKQSDQETDVRKKFYLWANNGLPKTQLNWLPDGALRAYVDVHGMIDDRRGVVTLFDNDGDFDLWAASDDELIEWGCVEEADKLREDPIFVAACEHIMKDNVDSFAIDW